MSTLYTISEQNLSMLPNNYTSPFSVKFAWARLRAQMPAPPRPTPCCPCPPVCSLAVQCGSVTRYTITELIYRCRIVYLLRSCCSTLLTVEDTAESTSAVACLYCERVESAPSLPRRALKTRILDSVSSANSRHLKASGNDCKSARTDDIRWADRSHLETHSVCFPVCAEKHVQLMRHDL